MRWRVALLSAFGVGWALLLAPPGVASAHATLVSSTPADESRLTAAPLQVTLTFDEAVSLGADAARVIAADGARADTGSAHLAPGGHTLVIPLRPDLPNGSYAATWRVVSADTHVVAGSIVFGVGVDPGSLPPTQAAQASSVTAADRIVHGVEYLGLVAGGGTAVVVLLLWPTAWRLRRIRWVIGYGWAALLFASLAVFVVRAAAAADVGMSQAFSAAVLGSATQVEHAGTLLARLVLTVALGVALRLPGLSARVRAATVAALAVGIAITVAADGHSSVGSTVWLALPVAAVHVLAMMVWLGGLAALLALLIRRPDGDPLTSDPLTPASLRRWSTLAFTLVATLVLTGEYQAWRQIDPVQSLWSTDYGVTLLVKLGVVLAMLVLALIGRRRLRPTMLRRTVPIEAACGVAVIIATSVLVTQPPARTTFGPTVSIAAPLDQRTAQVSITPTRRGPTTISVDLVDHDGKPVAAQQVHGTLSSSSANVPALTVKFATVSGTATPGSSWRSTAATVPLPGRWTLTLTVQFDPADALVTAIDYPVWGALS